MSEVLSVPLNPKKYYAIAPSHNPPEEREQRKQRARAEWVINFLESQRLPDDFLQQGPDLPAGGEAYLQQLQDLNKVLLRLVYAIGRNAWDWGVWLDGGDPKLEHQTDNLWICHDVFDCYDEEVEYFALIETGEVSLNHLVLLYDIKEKEERQRLEDSLLDEHLSLAELAQRLPQKRGFVPVLPVPDEYSAPAKKRLADARQRYAEVKADLFQKQVEIVSEMATNEHMPWAFETLGESMFVDLAFAVGKCMEALVEIMAELPPAQWGDNVS